MIVDSKTNHTEGSTVPPCPISLRSPIFWPFSGSLRPHDRGPAAKPGTPRRGPVHRRKPQGHSSGPGRRLHPRFHSDGETADRRRGPGQSGRFLHFRLGLHGPHPHVPRVDSPECGSCQRCCLLSAGHPGRSPLPLRPPQPSAPYADVCFCPFGWTSLFSGFRPIDSSPSFPSFSFSYCLPVCSHKSSVYRLHFLFI